MKIHIGGRELGYDVRGDGPAVVLLHAFPFDRRLWDDLAAPLSEGRRVLAIDLRGFGESALDGGYSIAELSDDVVGLLDGLGIGMASVAGMSMGGYVALALASRHPARLASLILCDTRAGADSPDGRRGRDEAIAAVQQKGAAAYLDGVPAKLLSPRAEPALRARVRQLAEQPPLSLVAALRALRDRPDRTAELPSLRVPAFVMVGADDAVTPPAEARAMAAAIPGARLVELPEAGHLAHLEAPAAFCRSLIEFLDEIGV
jgi:pimeloyl-ACP methyl ester carboxylesterase